MSILKKDAVYFQIIEQGLEDYTIELYQCDLEPKFETYTQDWNHDDDIYSMTGIYMKRLVGYGREFISEDEFYENCFEYVPTTENKYLESINGKKYKYLTTIEYKNKNYIIAENNGYKEIYAEDYFIK